MCYLHHNVLQCTARHHNGPQAFQWSLSFLYRFHNVPLLLQGGLVCDALHRRVRYMHCMHLNAPQWSASLPQRFRNSLQCTIMVSSAPQWYGSVLRCFCNALQCTAISVPQRSAMRRNGPQRTAVCLSVCWSTFSILAKRLSGIIQWDAVGDGGWVGFLLAY